MFYICIKIPDFFYWSLNDKSIGKSTQSFELKEISNSNVMYLYFWNSILNNYFK